MAKINSFTKLAPDETVIQISGSLILTNQGRLFELFVESGREQWRLLKLPWDDAE